jgi:hypothetical protein
LKKHAWVLPLLIGSLALGAAGSASASSCLKLRDIRDTVSNDGKTLVVTLNNGKVYNNRLQGVCSELKFQGFSWVTHNDEVCDNENTLRVLDSGQMCQLGVFVPAPPARKSVVR